MGLLDNKVAFVTGAAMGNGLGISQVLAEKGARVCMCDINEKVFKEAENLNKHGLLAKPIILDITDTKAVKKEVNSLLEEWGRIDILVNNAGISLLTPIEDMDEELKNKHFDVNINGPWNCVRAILPHMMENKYGRVINISSVTGPVVCDPMNIAYATTKSALLGFSKAIAIDTAEMNITSNAILPGYFDTPMVQYTAIETDSENPQRVIDEIAGAIPMGRLGKSKEIGYLVAFLASDESAYITGAEIRIDGGSTLPETLSVGR